jgi:mono/diheme cytochrome c family protein
MSLHSNYRPVKLAALVVFLVWAVICGRGALAQGLALPEGPGIEVARASCLSCHGPQPIQQQRLTRTQWQSEVEKMIRWGAEVPSESKDKLIDYFASHFPSRRIQSPKGPGSLPEGAGLEVVKESCLSCHGGEPITQQRLSRVQWTAEVDKMIRWGAEVPAEKKDAMIAYLAEHFSNVQ